MKGNEGKADPDSSLGQKVTVKICKKEGRTAECEKNENVEEERVHA